MQRHLQEGLTKRHRGRGCPYSGELSSGNRRVAPMLMLWRVVAERFPSQPAAGRR